MENFMKMLSTQAILLVYMAVGFYCRKRGIIEKKMQGKLTDFVLRITLPCMIFNSFSMHITLDMLKQAALCVGGVFYLLRGMARWKSCLQHVSEGEKIRLTVCHTRQ